MTAPLHARVVPANPKAASRLVVVEDDGTSLRVRWQFGRKPTWRCDACGPMDGADCPHTFAAGLALAESLLGLTRVPQLNPDVRTSA